MGWIKWARHSGLLAGAVILGLASSAIPAYADTAAHESETAEDLWRALETDRFPADVDRAIAAKRFVESGEEAMALLARLLPNARTDEERLDITYYTALIAARGRLSDRPRIVPPPAMMAQLASLLESTDDVMLQANLANIAAATGLDAAPMTNGLIALLRRTTDPGLRATAQAGLGGIGNHATQALYAEMRRSHDDRLRGDIAQILTARPLPDDITAIIKGLLASGNADVRRQALRALRDETGDKRAQAEAAAANLLAAQTDGERLMAATELAEVDGPPDIAAAAFAEALDALDRDRPSSARIQIARYLAGSGPAGVQALSRATAGAASQEERSDLVPVLAAQATGEPDTMQALLTAILHSDNPGTRRTAIAALTRIGEPALPFLHEALAWPDDAVRREARTALDAIRSKPAARHPHSGDDRPASRMDSDPAT